MSLLFEEKLRKKLDGFKSIADQKTKQQLFQKIRYNRKIHSRRKFREIFLLSLLVNLTILMPLNWKVRINPEDHSLKIFKTSKKDVQEINASKADKVVEIAVQSNVLKTTSQPRLETSHFYILKSKKYFIENKEISPIELSFGDLKSTKFFRADSPNFLNKRHKIASYVNFNAIFLYNRVKPDFNDELIITNYQGAKRLSANRLSLGIEYGFKNKISDKATVSFGALLYYHEENYTFDIRESIPSSYDLSASDGSLLITPNFKSAQIAVDHFQATAGAKLGGDFYIFPSSNSSLQVAIEYNYRLKKEQNFMLDGNKYEIYYPNILMLNLGFRKVLSYRKGQFSLGPNIRYSISDISDMKTLSVTPFGVGINLSYSYD